MPVSFPPIHPYPGKYRTLGHAARDNLLVVMRCNGCYKTAYFLASDLAEVVGKDHYAHIPPFKCSRCKTDEFIEVRVRCLRKEDEACLVLRRPAKGSKWFDEKLGTNAKIIPS